MQNWDELTNLLRDQMANIFPAPGGDLLMALVFTYGSEYPDPHRMPPPGAYERGRATQQLAKI